MLFGILVHVQFSHIGKGGNLGFGGVVDCIGCTREALWNKCLNRILQTVSFVVGSVENVHKAYLWPDNA